MMNWKKKLEWLPIWKKEQQPQAPVPKVEQALDKPLEKKPAKKRAVKKTS